MLKYVKNKVFVKRRDIALSCIDRLQKRGMKVLEQSSDQNSFAAVLL